MQTKVENENIVQYVSSRRGYICFHMNSYGFIFVKRTANEKGHERKIKLVDHAI